MDSSEGRGPKKKKGKVLYCTVWYFGLMVFILFIYVFVVWKKGKVTIHGLGLRGSRGSGAPGAPGLPDIGAPMIP